jgi:hypothetical protein
MPTEVRSPWSTSGNTSRNANGRIGVSPLSRFDQGGHIPGVHIGKGGMGPASLSRDQVPPRPTPVAGQPTGVLGDRR